MKKSILFLGLVILIFGPFHATARILPTLCSIINLIATPEKYDGKKILVQGYAATGFESTALYLSEDSLNVGDTFSAIWLNLKGKPHEYSNLRHKYVIVEGTFDANDRGHLGAYAGAIKDITRFEESKTPQIKIINRPPH